MQMLARPSLAQATTLGVGGWGLAELILETRQDYDAIPDQLRQEGGQPLVLGGGSNILFGDGEQPLLLIRPGMKPEQNGDKNAGIRVEAEAGNELVVRVESFVGLPVFLAWCAAQGLSGLEGLVGLPGKVGGAVAMNAGAYGNEMGALLREVEIWTPEQGFQRLQAGEWSVGYRHFAPTLPCEWFLIVSALLALPRSSQDEVRARMRANLEKKKATQPLGARSAGCVFKNPPGESAGKLLDVAGMRGKSRGGMWFTDKHANFLANQGGGTFAESMELIEEAKNAVQRHFNINLETELRIWPCPQA